MIDASPQRQAPSPLAAHRRADERARPAMSGPWPRSLPKIWKALSLSNLVLLVTACGGGGGADGSTNAQPASVATAITAQPADVNAVIGGPARFSVIVSGTTPTIRWQQSVDGGATWTDIAGATGPVYLISAITSSQVGYRFRAVVSSAEATVTSAVAGLNVNAAAVPPGVAVGLSPQSSSVGQVATFTVTATGTSPSFQWQRSPDGQAWVDIPGAIDAVLRLSALTASDNGTRIRVVVSNVAGRLVSDPVVLTVGPTSVAPMFTAAPRPVSVIAPGPATFSAATSTTPEPNYQWQRSNDAGASFVNIPGATSATLTLSATSLADDGARFRVVATNSAGSVASESALLTVTAAQAAAAITAQPQGQTVIEPATASFVVAASGTPAPSYQWQVSKDGGQTYTNITGATAATYVTPASSVADNAKRFRVVVSNSAGSVTSNGVELTVSAALSSQTSTSRSAFLCSPWSLGVGKIVRVVANAGTFSSEVKGPAVFEGRATTEWESTQSVFGITVVASTFASVDASTGVVTAYGLVSTSRSASGNTANSSTVKAVSTPPAVLREFSLQPGQSIPPRSQTSVNTTVDTVNGVTSAPVVTTEVGGSPGATFVGYEDVTVAAGTFSTCKYIFDDPSDRTRITQWIALGLGGITVKNSEGLQAFSVTVNGVRVTRN